ncbi:MAG TPA: exodeoxyribonuclease V subunit gamma [Candidatus Omnitrophota bacterium]|nr:exodeoxyribonuclease V subunit gamma [Candidatus Omnitrophota bacterium]HRY85429.1 exodeoxyribonuclease V subunit gamma [Candidatus Omnitrophota bacterium]
MSRTLLVGPAGCGKTHQLLDHFAEALKTAVDPLAEDLFFIVPSAEHTERVISLLMQRGLRGFFHKRVTTLSRLADAVFRIPDIPVATSLTRATIVRDLFRDNDWEYFNEAREQPGFAGLMTQFVTELKESCVSPEIFRERMNALKSFEPAYASKYEALAAFYEQYEIRLKERGLRDSQDALRIFRERKKKEGVSAARFKALWLDGFFDLSNLQLEYLRELSGLAENVTVTLTMEEGRDDVFDPAVRTRRDLEKAGFQEQSVKKSSCRTERPALLFLQKNIFSEKTAGKAPDPGKEIVLLEAIGTEGEIELIAREIHKLYAAGGYRYSDFAVLFRQIRDYAPVIASVFARYAIPAEVHERERLKFSPWIAAAASLLTVFKNGWQRGDLFDFLKSGYVRQTGKGLVKNSEWIMALEQYASRDGVKEGRDGWFQNWEFEGSKEREALNQKKTEMFKALADLEDRFRAARTAGDHVRIFRQAVYETFGIPEVSDHYTSLNRRDAASARRFEALLQEVEHYAQKNKVSGTSFEEFADHFLGLVELDVYSLHERDKNRVQIYDVSLARQKEYKVVFVSGLLEKVFPMQVREDPLLSDWERQLMNGGMPHPLAERLPRQNIERLLFYLAVTRAKERLYFSYPHLDFEGKESLPSFYLEEVKNLFEGKLPLVRQDLSHPFPKMDEAVTRRELEAAAAGVLRDLKFPSPNPLPLLKGGEDKGEGDLSEALFRLAGDPGSRERFLSALRPVEARIADEKILQGGFFQVKKTSPTRLETYAKCPYRYFAEKILRLNDDAADMRALQKGSILHHVLQRYFDPKREKDLQEKLETFISREIEEGLKQNPMVWAEPYQEALDRRELFEMLFDFLNYETERLKSASFKPLRVEHPFGGEGEGEAPALEVEGERRKIHIRGRIDRIDADDKKEFAVVMDYKRSSKFEISSMKLGTALQLPLYLLVAERDLKLKPLGGEIYSVRDHKRSGFYREEAAAHFEKEFKSRSKLPDEAFQKILDRALLFVRKFVKGIESAAIPARPRDCESFCPYDTVCRIEKWKIPVMLEEILEEDKKAGLREENPEPEET